MEQQIEMLLRGQSSRGNSKAYTPLSTEVGQEKTGKDCGYHKYPLPYFYVILAGFRTECLVYSHQPQTLLKNNSNIFRNRQLTSDTGKVQNSEDDEEIIEDNQNNQEDVEC